MFHLLDSNGAVILKKRKCDVTYTPNYLMLTVRNDVVIYHNDYRQDCIVFTGSVPGASYLTEVSIGVVIETMFYKKLILIRDGKSRKIPSTVQYVEWSGLYLGNRFLSWQQFIDGKQFNEGTEITGDLYTHSDSIGTETAVMIYSSSTSLKVFDSIAHKEIWTVSDYSEFLSICDSFISCGSTVMQLSDGEEVFAIEEKIIGIAQRECGYGYYVYSE